MTLNEFVLESHEMIEKFKAEWLKGLKETPDMYPLDLPEGEWDEQLRAYLGW